MIFIPFGELTRFDRSVALKFVQKHEPLCVQLVAHIRKSSENVFAAFLIDENAFKLYGIVSLNKTILHCLPFASESAALDGFCLTTLKNTDALEADFSLSLAALIKKMCLEKKLDGEDSLSCVNGTYSGGRLILDALKKLGRTPFQINQYDLLRLNFERFSQSQPFPLNDGEKIVHLKKNMDVYYRVALQRLQNDYEKEEVLPVGLLFDEDSCKLRLSNALRTQYVLALELPCKNDGGLSIAPSLKNSALVAKASTNAIGFRCAQIGGVYTDLKYRGRHYAFNTVFALLKKIHQMKKLPILFVKKSNTNAQKLYKNLGFEKICDYMIAYFL